MLLALAFVLALPGTTAAQCAPPYCAVSSAITEGATNVTPTTATLNGTVSSNGSETRYHFELAGGPSSPEGTLPADADRHSVSVDISGLQPSTDYRYRLVSVNASGSTSTGADVAFTTPATADSTQRTPAPVFRFPSSVPTIRGRTLRTGTRRADCFTFLSTPNVVKADAGDDVVRTGDYNDTVYGGPGDDRLALGKGQDVAHGDAGDDTIYGDGQSIPSCGSLRRARAAAAPRAKIPTIWNDRLEGGSGDDRLYGQAGDDRLTGGLGRDRIDGGVGNDQIFARDGERDVIVCGPGRDVVHADRVDKVGKDCEDARYPPVRR